MLKRQTVDQVKRMTIRLECRCGRALRLRDELAGKRIRCPECEGVLAVPDVRRRTAGGRECPYCHKRVPRKSYRSHIRKHEERQADGQMRDHRTLPKKRRAKKSRLRDQPRVYEHRRCGARTEMPTDIIRTYLADPFFYSAHTFCCGCEDYLPEREFVWVETGQPLPAHKWGLFLRRGIGYQIVWVLTHGVTIGAVTAGCAWLIAKPANLDPAILGTTTAAGGAVGLLFGLFAGRFIRLAIIRALGL